MKETYTVSNMAVCLFDPLAPVSLCPTCVKVVSVSRTYAYEGNNLKREEKTFLFTQVLSTAVAGAFV